MEAFTDFVVGHGELWSALLFAATLRKLGADAIFMDTRETVVVTPTSDGNSVDVDYPASSTNLDQWSHKNGHHQVWGLMLSMLAARSLWQRVLWQWAGQCRTIV